MGDSTDPETRLTLAQRVARAAAEPVEDNPLILAGRRARGRSILATAALGQAHPMLDAARRTPPGYDSDAVREAFAAVTGQAAREASAAVGGEALREAFAAVSGEAVREATEVLRASTGRAVPSHLSTAAMKAAAEMGSGAVGLATAGSTARAWADLGKIAPTLDPAIPPGLREALVRGIGQQRVSRAPAPSVPGSSPRARRLAPGRRAVSAPAPSVDVKLFKVQAENSQRQLATAEATRMLLEEMVQRVRESEARAVVAEKGRTIADRRSLLVTLVIGIPSVIASMPTVVDAVKWLVRVLS